MQAKLHLLLCTKKEICDAKNCGVGLFVAEMERKLKFAVEVQHLQALKQNFMSGLLLLVVNYVKLYLTILFKIPTGILRLCGQKGKNKRNQGLLFWTSMPWCRDSIFN